MASAVYLALADILVPPVQLALLGTVAIPAHPEHQASVVIQELLDQLDQLGHQASVVIRVQPDQPGHLVSVATQERLVLLVSADEE